MSIESLGILMGSYTESFYWLSRDDEVYVPYVTGSEKIYM